MNKFLLFCMVLIWSYTYTQISQKLIINKDQKKCHISKNEEHTFKIDLEKDRYYNIIVQQQGIDVVLYVKDGNNKILREEDSPTGKYGAEKISFSPDDSGTYIIAIKPLDEKENATQGNYTVRVTSISENLKKLSKAQLDEDFDLLKKMYVETHVGFWYNTYSQFDSICKVQKNKIKDKMTSWEFYKIVAPITAYTKEGHCNIALSDETNNFIKQNGTYFPFFVKIINRKIYILNDLNNEKTRGSLISKINGISSVTILTLLESIEPSDGYNYTSKEHWIESAFGRYMARFYGFSKTYSVEVYPTDKDTPKVYKVPSIHFKEYTKKYADFLKENPEMTFTKSSDFRIDSLKNYALLSVNSFNTNDYKNGKEGFQKYLDETFNMMSQKKIKNLVIDLRKNEGGTQGMEDILLSFLINDTYQKYNYVEIPATEYSFSQYTDYKGREEYAKQALSEEFYQGKDGRWINKKEFYQGLSPNPIHFDGQIYILISGLTFSGGSEFATLAKNHTNAIFVGEETGGGYYGNTSGTFFKFTLPNSGLTGRIPLCKFVVNTPYDKIPFGRGLFPDHYVQSSIKDVLNKKDIELEYVESLIEKNTQRK